VVQIKKIKKIKKRKSRKSRKSRNYMSTFAEAKSEESMDREWAASFDRCKVK
jgi:hypothetical protein